MKSVENTTSKAKHILIMAGGTGGHIFPALAIAKELSARGAQTSWLGADKGMENTLVPKHNIPIHTVSAVGLRGKNLSSLIKAPFLLTKALLQTLKVFKQVKPDVVLGMGGFASGIGGLVAWLLRIPLVIHEQNSIAGTTNTLLNKLSTQTFQAFDGAFANSDKLQSSGNPVLFQPKAKTQRNKKLNLLVIGGSLGAKPINDVLVQLDNLNINIHHQTGKAHLEKVREQYRSKNVKVEAFIEDMAKAYAWADVVLCRAGAMTVSELMLCGTASILIPLPHAIDNHQYYNAKILADADAAILLEQKDLTPQSLSALLENLDQESATQMGECAKQLASPRAATMIANYLLEA